MLQKILKERMQDEGLTLRSASDQIGISHATLDRVLHGKPVSIDTLVHISEWTGISLTTIIHQFDTTKEDSLYNTIAALIEAEPNLKAVFRQATDKLNKGEISLRDLRDVAAYAAYKLSLASEENNETDSYGVVPPGRQGYS